jgi:hypothetical protein
MGFDRQAYLYAEELLDRPASEVARHARELGLDGVSVALTYHRARRILPRAKRRISWAPSGAVYFHPTRERYRALWPGPATDDRLANATLELRAACDREGVGFRAWLVVLHHEGLARSSRHLAATTADGTPTEHSLCPSSAEARTYAQDLVADVCARYSPDAVDAEALIYPAWEPAYAPTIALGHTTPAMASYMAQCVCGACARLARELDLDLEALGSSARAAFDAGVESADDEVRTALRSLRAAGVRRMREGVIEVASRFGAQLRVMAYGLAETIELQGATAEADLGSGASTIGVGSATGDDLIAAYRQFRALVGGGRVHVGITWSPQMTGPGLRTDLRRLMDDGAAGFSFYNLTLVPEDGLTVLQEATREEPAG